ncbi:hypothetical protein Enr13x_24210 [Stieleria neptunia]|uniref:Phage integrase family protein n=1 Tax=Stieleria neptunia TaxID=2527979 RepID=A0A518HP01_9BACT|nr:hypothetical protein [Stieleria neptunia]QDV42573.1 hypothetical protein Enr13x_24210 [Stieleria neptunia]
MPRKPSPMPGYKFHTSGQARVFLNRKAYYLGEYDSPESYARYHNLLAIYNANGQKMPDDVPTHQIDLPLTIGCLTAEFRENLKSRYANNKHERRRFSNLSTLLEDEYGDLPLDAFGPIKLADVRDLFVASGNCRNYVNQQTRNIVRIFKFGVSRELVTAEQLKALESLESLRRGQTTAKESVLRSPVNLDDVRSTAAHLSPTLKAMVRVQAATGMRSTEVCIMRPVDLTQEADGNLVRFLRFGLIHVLVVARSKVSRPSPFRWIKQRFAVIGIPCGMVVGQPADHFAAHSAVDPN